MSKRTETATETPAVRAAQTSAEPILIARGTHPSVADITLNRASARNALSLDMIMALHDALRSLAEDSSVKAIVIAASGPAFSAGHDLKELNAHRADADGGRAFFEETMSHCAAMMCEIAACPVPVIAAVEGVATAAGCQLVAACDLAYAGQRATFQTPGVNIGLFCSTPMVALSRAVPRKHALEMLFTGRAVDAAEAERIGLINAAVGNGDALAAAHARAADIVTKSRRVVAMGKQAFYRQIELPMADAYRAMAEVMVENMMDADACHGIESFLAKSPPNWSA